MGGAQQFSRLASRRVVSADAGMQVHPTALPLEPHRPRVRSSPRNRPRTQAAPHPEGAPGGLSAVMHLAQRPQRTTWQRPQDALLRNDARVVSPDADGFPAGAVRLLAGADGVPVPGATDALDNADVVGDHGQPDPHGATCSRPSSSRVRVMSWGRSQSSRPGDRRGSPGIAAGGSVAGWKRSRSAASALRSATGHDHGQAAKLCLIRERGPKALWSGRTGGPVAWHLCTGGNLIPLTAGLVARVG